MKKVSFFADEELIIKIENTKKETGKSFSSVIRSMLNFSIYHILKKENVNHEKI